MNSGFSGSGWGTGSRKSPNKVANRPNPQSTLGATGSVLGHFQSSAAPESPMIQSNGTRYARPMTERGPGGGSGAAGKPLNPADIRRTNQQALKSQRFAKKGRVNSGQTTGPPVRTPKRPKQQNANSGRSLAQADTINVATSQHRQDAMPPGPFAGQNAFPVPQNHLPFVPHAPQSMAIDQI